MVEKRQWCSADDLGISGIPQAPSGPVWVWPWLGRGSALLYPQLGVGGCPVWLPAVSPTGRKVQFEGCRTGPDKEKEEKNYLYLRKLLNLGPSRPSEDLVQIV